MAPHSTGCFCRSTAPFAKGSCHQNYEPVQGGKKQNDFMNPYVTLFIAIVFEITGTTALKISDGLTRLVPSLFVLVGYCVSFWLMSLTLKELPVSVAYAIWCGVGILGIACIGTLYFGEVFGLWHIIGTLLIVGGVYILTLVTEVH